MSNAALLAAIFYRDTKPNMAWTPFVPVTMPQEIAHQRRSFRKHLKCVPMSALHSVAYAVNEFLRYMLVEEVTH